MASLTSDVKYDLKPTSLLAQRKTHVAPSSNADTFAPLTSADFYVPALRNSVLDGASVYLKFKVTVTGAGRIDGTASSFIERITVYSGNLPISDIVNYRSLACAMTDLQYSVADKLGLSSLLGCENEIYTPTDAANAFATASKPLATELQKILPVANRRGKAVANAGVYNFAIPLLGPLFAGSEKAFPLYALNSDLHVVIQWSSATSALVTSTDFSISKPEIICDILQFDSSAMSVIESVYKGRELVIPAQDWRAYSVTISASSSGNQSYILPAKQKSARMALIRFRPAETQIAGAYATGCSISPLKDQGDWMALNIGGQPYPTKFIQVEIADDMTPFFAQTQVALHSLGALEMNGCLTDDYYNVTARQNGYSNGTDSYQAGFVAGINLNTLRGNQNSFSGTDLSQVTTYLELSTGSTPKNVAGNAQSLSGDVFILHDVLLVIDESGQCYSRF